ncbi:ABC transporter ATP-binding protein/permease [Hyphobacterium sp. SN044]|uniref:ABC transporter ATP-binding protein n=1 Tax=Hyphobacterium sp. SN044 TaxID=2912575 RepID=UPI001F3FC670|nr:ABC transporter ATP-binding protein [Hyphobacterium sp. SN044]MCF8880597.1 ABC transporter ATP-binding protein/permease [Hyphobacterium sp. SN044]
MNAETPRARSTGELTARLWRDWLAHRWPLVLVAVLLSALTAAAVSSYAFVLSWTMELLERSDERVIWIAPIAIFAMTAVRGLSLFAQTVQTNRLALRVMQELQERMFVRLVRADFARLLAEPVGSLVSRFTNDITLLREALVRAANNLLRDTLTVVGAVAAMFWFDWMLAILVLFVYPIAALPVVRIGQRLRKTSNEAQQQMGEVTSFLEESFSGVRMVKTYQLEEYEEKRSHGAFLKRFRLALKLAASRARVDPILEVIGGIALAGVLGFAGWRISNGEMSVPDVIGFIAAIGVMAPAVRALGTLNAVVQEGLAVLDRVFTVIDTPDAVTEAPDAKPLKLSGGAVEFDNVAFAYGEDAPALHGISMRAEPGQTIAFVGPSGSGKTTILNLIPRLYDPTEGRVLIDGQNIRSATIASVRQTIALVSQDVTLFDDTVRANIAFGRLDASDEEIAAAAKAADAHDFITALPGGYDAPVGPRGGQLSGGQRQRIAIARAILKDAPILLLDEATSALDAEAEARVQEALSRLTEGRTSFVIAHRLATVRNADWIYVLDQGRIAEQGRHDDLVAKDGLYARLSKLQFAAG